MTPLIDRPQLLADALGVPVRRVRRDEFGDLMATTGRVRWTLHAYSLSANAGQHWVSISITRRRPVLAAVVLARAGLEAMGARVPLILRWTGDTLYARRVGDPFAVGYAVGSYVRVYEPAGNGDTVRQSRNDNANPLAGLLAMLATYYPGVPVVEVTG